MMRSVYLETEGLTQDDTLDSIASFSSSDEDCKWMAFEASTYGAFIFSYCRLIAGGSKSQQFLWYLKMSYAIILHWLATVLAVVLVFALLATSIEIQEDDYEVNLQNKTEILKQHIALGRAINTTDDNCTVRAEYLCYLDKTLPFSHPITVFVLTMKMTPEIMEGIWLIVALWCTPLGEETRISCRKSHDSHDQRNVLTSLTRASKAMIFIFVPLTKISVAVYVLYVGSKQIILNHTTFKLIMQVVGLTYITSMDEWVFNAFFGLPFQDKVKSTYFRIFDTKNLVLRNECLGPAKLLCAVIVTWYLWQVRFQELSEFRYACRIYRHMFPPGDWSPYDGLKAIGIEIW